jgi:hypothetical protein
LETNVSYDVGQTGVLSVPPFPTSADESVAASLMAE